MLHKEFGLISIIMAAYNAEKTIEQAINSVLRQTYTDFELLVVNDCSKDRTVELVKSIAAKDNRVRLISNEKNSGVSFTRKHGLEESNGSWIAILDSDDAWTPDKLEKQIELQKRTNADLLFTGSAFYGLGWAANRLVSSCSDRSDLSAVVEAECVIQFLCAGA